MRDRTAPGARPVERRTMMRGLAGLGAVSGLVALAAARRAAAGGLAEIVQPVKADREQFMGRAVTLRRRAEARGDQPYGAVVVQDGRIVGEGASAVVADRDPTAHAEMEAIRDACRRLGTSDLGGCEIYATSRPCRMCETACFWARIARMYVGDPVTDAGAPRYTSC